MRPRVYTSTAPQRTVRTSWSCLSLWIGVELLLLVGILVSQPIFRRRFAIMEIDLPALSTFALGPAFPVAGGVLLVLTVWVHIGKNERYVHWREPVLIILLGGINRKQ